MERITQNSLQAKILQAQYWRVPGTNMTVCAITLRNGFVVTGQSAATQAEFDAEKGREIAYDDAFKKLWPLEMYRVRDNVTKTTARKDEVEQELGEPFTRENDPDAPLTFDD